jgi:hypothetical protein
MFRISPALQGTMSDAADPGPLSEDAVREEIAQLEARIESLTDSIERCRKISLFARFVLAAGAAWIALMLLRLLPFAPFSIVGAIAAVLGGTVLVGSNGSTWNQMLASRTTAEMRRRELIDRIALDVVTPAPAGSRFSANFLDLPPGKPTLH